MTGHGGESKGPQSEIESRRLLRTVHVPPALPGELWGRPLVLFRGHIYCMLCWETVENDLYKDALVNHF